MSLSKLMDQPVFDDSVKKQECHKYFPQTKSFDYNDTVEIAISQQDVFMAFSESCLELECEITPDAAAGEGTCELTNNVGAFLFSNMTYELNNHVIETVREPGLVSTLRSFALLTPNESKALSLAGWTPDTPVIQKDGRFFLSIPLSFLFSVFYDFRTPIIGKHVFRLTRAANDSNCYQSIKRAEGVATEGTKKATIHIHSMALSAMHIHPNDSIRLKIMSQVEKQSPFVISFRKWDFMENPNVARSTQDLWTVKTLSGLERPRFIIVALQTDIRNSFTKNATYLSHNKITKYESLPEL